MEVSHMASFLKFTPSKNNTIMIFAESFFDRHMLSTDNNEYANGLNDENEWEEDIVEYDVPLDDEADEFLENSDNARQLYNESGFDRIRIN
jgi:hypothetical protein